MFAVQRPIFLFKFKEIPVFVDIWYFGLLAYYLWFGGVDIQSAMIFCVCVTASLLVHEFGHGLVARYYKLNPQIMLHAFGGLCAHDRARRDIHDVWIISAGPGVELVFGGLAWSVQQLLLSQWPTVLINAPWLAITLMYLVYINVFWALLNLVPLFPLDGGQLFRMAMMRLMKPATADRVVAVVSLGLCVAGVVYFRSAFVAIICLFLGIENVRILRGEMVLAGPRRHNSLAAELLKQAQAAMAAGNPAEAARLCHQIRNERNVDPQQLDTVWELLSLAVIEQGRYEEGLRFSRFAKPTPALVAAKLRALTALGRTEEAQALLDSDEARQLPASTRADLESTALDVIGPAHRSDLPRALTPS